MRKEYENSSYLVQQCDKESVSYLVLQFCMKSKKAHARMSQSFHGTLIFKKFSYTKIKYNVKSRDLSAGSDHPQSLMERNFAVP